MHLFMSLIMLGLWVQFFSKTTIDNETEVVLLVEVFRHGARTPTTSLFKEKYEEKLGKGFLTPNGMRQHYILGKQIRANYEKLFQPTKEFDYNKIEMFSSSSKRARLSAISHLLGLFKLEDGWRITGNNKKVQIPPFEPLTVGLEEESFSLQSGYMPQLINIETDPSKEQLFMQHISQSCPKAQTIRKTYPEKEYSKKKTTIFKEVESMLKKNNFDPFKITGNSEWSLKTLSKLSDNFYGHYYYFGEHYKDEERSVSQELFDRIRLVTSWKRAIYNSYQNMNKVMTTRLAEKIIESMKNKINALNTGQNDESKVYVGFSGHDTNLYPLILNLGLSNIECITEELKTGISQENCEKNPEVASNLLFELSQELNSNNFYVKIIYNGKSIDYCPRRLVKNGCSFDQFERFMKERFIYEDFNNFCELEQSNNNKKFYLGTIIILIGLVIAFLIAFLITNGKYQNEKAMNERLLSGKELLDLERNVFNH